MFTTFSSIQMGMLTKVPDNSFEPHDYYKCTVPKPDKLSHTHYSLRALRDPTKQAAHFTPKRFFSSGNPFFRLKD